MATPRSANGSILYHASGVSPFSWTEVGAISDLQGPQFSSTKIDTTNHNTTTGYETFIMGLKTSGQVTTKIFFDSTDNSQNENSNGLLGLFEAQTLETWRIRLGRTGTQYFTFTAYVQDFKMSFPVNGAMTADVTFAISDRATLA